MSDAVGVVRELVERARRLPAEIEGMVLALADRKQALHDLVQVKAQIEASLAGEVASEVDEAGRKRYPNEESRKAEIARRLQENREYQETEQMLRDIRQECVELEARLDRARYEHRAATTLLYLVASGVQGGNQAVVDAVLGVCAADAAQDAAREEKMRNFVSCLQTGEVPHESDQQKGSGQAKGDYREARVTVLEARPGKSENVVRAYCETGDGERVAVYGKNGTGRKLAALVGQEITVKFREGNYGWFAVAVK
jgi:hypothetical protein